MGNVSAYSTCEFLAKTVNCFHSKLHTAFGMLTSLAYFANVIRSKIGPHIPLLSLSLFQEHLIRMHTERIRITNEVSQSCGVIINVIKFTWSGSEQRRNIPNADSHFIVSLCAFYLEMWNKRMKPTRILTIHAYTHTHRH